MKSDLANLLRQAAAELQKPTKRMRGYYAASLEEVVEHIEQVRSGAATIAEFAEHYCMEPKVSAAREAEGEAA